MGWKTKYNIEFKGLKEGLHEFEYIIEDKFFEHFEQGPVNVGSLRVSVKLEKRGTFLKLFFDIQGWVELTCDRCLEKYRQELFHKDEIYVKFGEVPNYNDDEIIWVLPEEHRINLAQLIFEFISVSIPLKQVHPLKSNGECGCNKEMLYRLEEYSTHSNKKTETDPRWDILKKIRNYN